MANIFIDWYKRYFSDPEGVILFVLLVLGFATIYFLGGILGPLLASIVIAYFLEGLVRYCEGKGLPRGLAVTLAFMLFLAVMLFLFLGLVPLLSGQVTQLVQDLPNMIARWQQLLLQLPERYPTFITETQINDFLSSLASNVETLGQTALSFSLASIGWLFQFLLYLVLLPVLVLFLMKDKVEILQWLNNFMPKNRSVADVVWKEMDQQIGNYIRGKFIEILIVGSVAYVVFAVLGLNYAPLLAAAVGLSVIIPYIGAITVTFPVIIVAYFQWGFGPEFTYVAVAYLILQILDGNVLVPLLFSEVVKLHPVAIIAAILFFGGIWGFWGVFFAIPLATLVKAVIYAWPQERMQEETVESASHNSSI